MDPYYIPKAASTVPCFWCWRIQKLGRQLSAVAGVKADNALQSIIRVLCLKHNTLATQTFPDAVNFGIFFEGACRNWTLRAGELTQAMQSYEPNKLAPLLHFLLLLGEADTLQTLSKGMVLGRSAYLTGT